MYKILPIDVHEFERYLYLKWAQNRTLKCKKESGKVAKVYANNWSVTNISEFKIIIHLNLVQKIAVSVQYRLDNVHRNEYDAL